MSIDIVSLACPVCGAPFAANDEKCSYCGSILVLKTDHPRINPASLNKQIIDEKISGFRSALRQDHTDSSARYGLGVAYFNLRLTDDAVRELEEAARLMPENPNIQSQLAVVLKQAVDEGRPGAAAKLKDRIEYALRLDPDNVDALLLKSETDSRLSSAEALKLVEKAYKIDPKRGRKRLLAVVDNAAENYGLEASIGALQNAHRLDPNVDSAPLSKAMLAQAKKLSDSNPKEDVTNPSRAAEALTAWMRLFDVSGSFAEQELTRYMQSIPDLKYSSRRQLSSLSSSTTNSAGWTQRSTTATTSMMDRYAVPIMKGILKAIGILVLLIALFTIFENVNIISHFIAIASLVTLFVAPIVFPVREIRKVHGDFSTNTIDSARAPSETVSGTGDRLAYTKLLRILRTHFMNRWNKEYNQRIKLDKTAGGSGTLAERRRGKQFREALKFESWPTKARIS